MKKVFRSLNAVYYNDMAFEQFDVKAIIWSSVLVSPTMLASMDGSTGYDHLTKEGFFILVITKFTVSFKHKWSLLEASSYEANSQMVTFIPHSMLIQVRPSFKKQNILFILFLPKAYQAYIRVFLLTRQHWQLGCDQMSTRRPLHVHRLVLLNAKFLCHVYLHINYIPVSLF